MNLIAQGYPMFAAVAGELDDGEIVVGVVVGWVPQDEHEAWPFVAMPSGMAYLVRPSFTRYVGPDRSAAVAAARPQAQRLGALSATRTGERRSPARRYAPGAVALCGLLNVHEPHLWQPDEHEYTISCPGGTP